MLISTFSKTPFFVDMFLNNKTNLLKLFFFQNSTFLDESGRYKKKQIQFINKYNTNFFFQIKFLYIAPEKTTLKKNIFI